MGFGKGGEEREKGGGESFGTGEWEWGGGGGGGDEGGRTVVVRRKVRRRWSLELLTGGG